MKSVFRFVLSFCSIILAGGFFSSSALAEPTQILVHGSYSSSDYEINNIGGMSENVSGSGFRFGVLFFPLKRVYLSYDQSEEGGDLFPGADGDVSITDIGGGLVLGRRLDHRAGIGFEHRIGLQSTEVEVNPDFAPAIDKTVLFASYNLGWGLGNGFSVDLSAQASLDDIGDDRSFGLGVNKSFGKNYLLGFSRDSHKFDRNLGEAFPLSFEATSLVFSFGVIF